MPPLIARYVADYFLATGDDEAGDDITNLKLQKLLYYAQGFHLAMQDGLLFAEPIEAWDLGPVVPPVYHLHKSCGRHPLGRPAAFDPEELAPETIEILEAVRRVYGQFSPWKLCDMTHAKDSPWDLTPKNRTMHPDLIRAHFARMVEVGRGGASLPGEPAWPTESFRHQRRREIMGRVPSRDRLRELARRAPSPDPWVADDQD